MKDAFWKEKWRKGQIGFHQQQINNRLNEFFPQLLLPQGSGVFVPLSGKSLDMLRIRELGHRVIGVELSKLAVDAFFAESELTPVITSDLPFTRYEAEGITIFLGDFFSLRENHLTSVAGFYDRASLIAFPPEMRPRYAEHLISILPSSAVGLTIAAEYNQSEMNGPPFSVGEDEIRELFGTAFQIETAARQDILEESRFRERLSTLTETVFILRR